jgi:hypothetical protein
VERPWYIISIGPEARGRKRPRTPSAAVHPHPERWHRRCSPKNKCEHEIKPCHSIRTQCCKISLNWACDCSLSHCHEMHPPRHCQTRSSPHASNPDKSRAMEQPRPRASTRPEGRGLEISRTRTADSAAVPAQKDRRDPKGRYEHERRPCNLIQTHCSRRTLVCRIPRIGLFTVAPYSQYQSPSRAPLRQIKTRASSQDAISTSDRKSAGRRAAARLSPIVRRYASALSGMLSKRQMRAAHQL